VYHDRGGNYILIPSEAEEFASLGGRLTVKKKKVSNEGQSEIAILIVIRWNKENLLIGGSKTVFLVVDWKGSPFRKRRTGLWGRAGDQNGPMTILVEIRGSDWRTKSSARLISWDRQGDTVWRA